MFIARYTNRLSLFAGVLATTLALSTSDHALAATADDPQPSWALGASLAVGPLYYAGLGGLGGLSSSPTGGLVAERRVDPHWWFTFGVEAAISDFGAESSQRTLAGQLGVRYVLSPDAPVQVALVVALEAGAAEAEVGGATAQGTEAVHAGIEGGLDVEVPVTAGFALRLRTTLLRVAWSRVTSTDDGVETEYDGVQAGLGLRPSLAAVFSF